MTIEIVESSPQAIELAKTIEAKKYPFDELKVGQSFRLALADANVASLRAVASRKSRKGVVFKVIIHDTAAVVEVARIS